MPPRMGFMMRNANRDYVLLNTVEGEDDPEKQEPSSKVSAARLVGLARGELGTIAVATVLLLIASLAQVGGSLRGVAVGRCMVGPGLGRGLSSG